jgi:hypothetical protein
MTLNYKLTRFKHIFFMGVGVRLCLLGTPATDWPVVPDPGDRLVWSIGVIKIGRGSQSTWRKHAPVPLCSPQIPHDLNLGSNPDRCGGKPVTNSLSYGMALTFK